MLLAVAVGSPRGIVSILAAVLVVGVIACEVALFRQRRRQTPRK